MFQVELKLGDKCNNNCSYCISSPIDDVYEIIDLEKLFESVDEKILKPFKVTHLSLTGGETGIYADQIIKGIENISPVNLIIYSNGTILESKWKNSSKFYETQYVIALHESSYDYTLNILKRTPNNLNVGVLLILSGNYDIIKIMNDIENLPLKYVVATPMVSPIESPEAFNFLKFKADFLVLSPKARYLLLEGYRVNNRSGSCQKGKVLSISSNGELSFCSQKMYNNIGDVSLNDSILKDYIINQEKLPYIEKCNHCYNRELCSLSTCDRLKVTDGWCDLVNFYEQEILKDSLLNLEKCSPNSLISFDIHNNKYSYAPNFHLFFKNTFNKNSTARIGLESPLLELTLQNMPVIEKQTLGLITYFFRNSDLTEHILFNITENCNLRCSYCYASVGTKDIDSGFVFKTIDTYNPKRISFLGGEPLLNRQVILDCLEKYPDKGIDFVTNGTIIDLELFKKFKKITISIDCPDKDNRVFMTGVASFRTVKHTVRYTLEQTDIDIELKVVLTNDNYRYWKIMRGLQDTNRISMHILFDHFSEFDEIFYNEIMDRMYFEFFEILNGTTKLQHSIFTSFPSIADENNLSHRIGSSCSVGRSLTFSIDTLLFPCVEIASNNKFKDAIAATKEEVRDMTFQDRLIKLDKCSNCIIRYVCSGCLYFGDNERICKIKRRGTILATFLRLQKFENIDTLIEEQIVDRLHFLEKSDV